MPSRSAKQARFMNIVAHSPKFAREAGIAQSVGQEFHAADKRAGKYFAGGGQIKSALMLLREALAAKKVSPTLPEVLGEETKNLPAVVSPAAGANPAHGIDRVIDAAAQTPVTRRQVLKQAVGAAARSALPELGGLGQVAQTIAGPGLSVPGLASKLVPEALSAATAAPGSFENVVLPGLVKVAKEFRAHPRVRSKMDYYGGRPTQADLLELAYGAHDNSFSNPEISGTLRHLLSQHLPPETISQYQLDPQKFKDLLEDLGYIHASRDPYETIENLSIESLGDALNIEGPTGASIAGQILGKHFPMLKRLDIGAADKPLGQLLGARGKFTRSYNSLTNDLEETLGEQGASVAHIIGEPGSWTNPAKTYGTLKGSISQLFPNRNKSLYDRAKLQGEIDKYRHLQTIEKDFKEDGGGYDPEWEGENYAEGGSVDAPRVWKRGEVGSPLEELMRFGEPLGALGKMLYGGARGAATATLGMPGELERMARGANAALTLRSNPIDAAIGAMGEPTYLPDMSDVRGYLTRAGLPPSDVPHERIMENAPLTPGQATRLLRPVVGGLGKLAAEGIRRGVEDGRGPLSALRASAAPMYAVRNKGGNFDPVRTEAYLAANLGVEGPQGFAGFIPEGRELTPQANTWGQKQLYNYLTKDLGSTTDPLLAVEKEGRGMHIPADMMTNPEWLESRTAAWRSGRPMVKEERAIFDKHYGLTQEPLTPWGELSSSHVYTQPAKEYLQESDIRDLKEFASWHNKQTGETIFKDDVTPYNVSFKDLLAHPDNKHLKPFAWYEKNPEAQVHSLIDPHEDPFGFSHVMDYLDAAQKPHGRGLVGSQVGTAEEIAQGKKDYINWLRNNHPDLRMLPFRQTDIDMDRALVNAGLDLHPDDLGRLSVADAVRKTRDWNALLAENGALSAPDLARGHVPFKEYPEQGMKWVQFKPGEAKPIAPVTEEDVLKEANYQLGVRTPVNQFGVRSDGKPKTAVEDLIFTKEGLPEGAPGRLVDPLSGEIIGYGPTEEAARASYMSSIKANLEGRRAKQAHHDAQAELAAGLNAEGKHMGHCVGGYCDEVADRGTQIYSLRDKNGNPHVTVEVRPPPRTLDELYNDGLNGEKFHGEGSYEDRLYDLGQELSRRKVFSLGQGTPWRANASRQPLPSTGASRLVGDQHRTMSDLFDEITAEAGSHKASMDWLKQAAPDLYEKYNAPGKLPDIYQIKGKGNAAPVDRYKPFVQDFVKSGKWGRVGDLHNTGLKQYKGGYHTDEDLWKMIDEHPRFQKIKGYHGSNPYPPGSAGRMMIDRENYSDPAKLLDVLENEKFNLTDSGRDAKTDYASGGSVDEDDVMPQFASHMNIEEPQPRFASLLSLKG